MRLRFGAQDPKQVAKARWKADDISWATSWVWWKKTGKPPREFEDYTVVELLAFLVFTDEIADPKSADDNSDPETTTIERNRRWGPPTLGKVPWSEAARTGDPQIDKWEREIAAGMTPVLE
jgi:hypothetical protein